MRVGILALQGDYEAHARAVAALAHEPVLVRYPEQLTQIRCLIIPGGESTAMKIISGKSELGSAVVERARKGLRVMGTCAGLVLMAQEVEGEPPGFSLGLLPIKVARNAYGRQVESFEAPVRLSFSPRPLRGIFIRAPRIREVGDASPVAWWEDEVVAVEHGGHLGASFHPELTHDLRLHEFFLRAVK